MKGKKCQRSVRFAPHTASLQKGNWPGARKGWGSGLCAFPLQRASRSFGPGTWEEGGIVRFVPAFLVI